MIRYRNFKKNLFMANTLIQSMSTTLMYFLAILTVSSFSFHCKANSSDDKKNKILYLFAIFTVKKPTNNNIIIQTGNSVVTTVADSNKVGYSTGLTIDSNETLYLADERSSVIRTLTSNGIATVIAGSLIGNKGYVDATGSAARFNSPTSIARDTTGNLFIADSGNNAIRKITSSGIVTTHAGNGTAGFVDGTATTARFNFPRGIAIDTNGNLYVSDNGNNAIRKITSSGVVTTLAGNGTAGFIDANGTAAQFRFPVGIALDGNGIVYVGDNGNAIRKITSSGVVTTLAGNGTAGFVDANGIDARFYGLGGIAIDGSGNLYVGDSSNNAIRKVDSTGLVRTIAGNGISDAVDGIGINARLYLPDGMVLDASGNLYLADYGNGRLRHIKLNP